MPRAAEDDVKGVLSIYHGRIRRVVERAWADCRTIAKLKADAGIAPNLYRRTLANDVFDAIARYAIVEFGTDPKVKLKVEAQTVKLIFQGKVITRFKKGDANKLGRNIATQAALAFANPEGELAGLPHATKVEFIWLANELQTKLESVLVVARDKNRLLWDYEIPADERASVVPLPVSNSLPDLDDDELVKPKTNNYEKKKTE